MDTFDEASDGSEGTSEGEKNSQTLFLKRRLIPPQNILLHLRNREIHAPIKGTQMNRTLKFYHSVHPDLTVINVEKPGCFLRKFSPNGRYLVAFSAQQSDIEIYEFLGVSAAGNLLHNAGDLNCTRFLPATMNSKIRERIFSSLFRLRHIVQVTAGHDQLNRECSIFSEDSRYVLVGSSLAIPDDPLSFPRMFDFYRNNESLEPQNVEDYWIHVVDMKEGRLTDTKQFKCDKIHLAHNQGLYLLRSTLAVLSVQHQTVHLYKLDSGILVHMQSIGRCVLDDDEMFMKNSLNPMKFQNVDDEIEMEFDARASTSSTNSSTSTSGRNVDTEIISYRRHFDVHEMAEKLLNTLKQRLLSALYKNARDEFKATGNCLPLRKFYQRFEFFKSLRIWKMQLIDESHLLLRYLTENALQRLNKLDAISQISFFVFYNISTTEVVGIYENLSETMLNLFENFADYFRNSPSRFPCGVSSSHHAFNSHDRIKQTVLHARNGGKTEMVVYIPQIGNRIG